MSGICGAVEASELLLPRILLKGRMIPHMPKNVKKNRKIVVDNEKSFVI